MELPLQVLARQAQCRAGRSCDFVLTEGQTNAFDKAQAQHLARTTKHRVRVLKMSLLNINRVLEEHFGGAPGRPPDRH